MAGALLSGGVASAQIAGWFFCEDLSNQNGPHSDDYSVASISTPGHWPLSPAEFQFWDDTPLIMTSLGQSGNTAWSAACLGRAFSVNHSGRFGFGSGPIGSIQSTIDDNMMYTVGMPADPGNSFGYAVVTVGAGNDKTLFGSGPWRLFFRGESDRKIIAENDMGGVVANLRIDVLGDAARYEWNIRTSDGGTTPLGLWSGHWIGLVRDNGEVRGFDSANAPFIFFPGQRLTNLETRWKRKENPAIFPPYIDFAWSQSEPYGLRIETGPSPSTTDPKTGVSDATQADEFVLGNHGEAVVGPGLLGDFLDATPEFADQMFPIVKDEPGIEQSDLRFDTNPAYILKYGSVNGSKRKIVQYYRDTWSQSSYTAPYTVVVDAPKLFNYDPNGVNGLTPNPATIRVWVDNVLGFTSAEDEVPLNNVRITLDLTNTQGITFSGGGKTQTKVISQINPRRIGFVDFQVTADGVSTGIQPMTVTVVAPPGPTKTLTVITDISTTPKLPVIPGSNLITLPWNFADTSWTSILGLSQPSQFQAFNWDPVQQGYVLSTSAQRGRATWLIFDDLSVIPGGVLSLAGEPNRPTDMQTGTGLLELTRGWNLIGNPYPYPVSLGELLGVAAGDPTHTFRWQQLVDANLVAASLAYWDINSNPPGYKFISGVDALIQPNRGYWMFVKDTGLTLKFPPVSYEGAIVTGGGAAIALNRTAEPKWVQSDKQWRLQLAARSNDEIDDQNFVGVAASTRSINELTIYEPPMGPRQNLGVSISAPKISDTRLAQAMSTTTGQQEWSVLVQNKKGGQTTLTWPNMSTVPKNVRFRLTDVATGTSRDMRRSSGYTFTSEANTTREFKISAEPGGVSRALIGNVTVGRDGRARSSAYVINYTLSGDATTTVRILGAGGKEVYTATRGRADRAGQNSALWALRDNANRAVAPGTYRVEITAETSDGERVRKIVPINVIR